MHTAIAYLYHTSKAVSRKMTSMPDRRVPKGGFISTVSNRPKGKRDGAQSPANNQSRTKYQSVVYRTVVSNPSQDILCNMQAAPGGGCFQRFRHYLQYLSVPISTRRSVLSHTRGTARRIIIITARRIESQELYPRTMYVLL